MKALLAILPCLFFFACGMLKPIGESSPTKPNSNLASLKREPGSLWSENSKWNELYSAASGRSVGDGIRVRIGPSLKSRLRLLADKDPGKYPPESPPKDNRALASVAPPTAAAATTTDEDPIYLDVTIKEIQPKSVFRVVTNQTIRFDNREAKLQLEGNVRERDIAMNDTASSDDMFNVAVEAKFFDLEAHRVAATKAESKKEDAAAAKEASSSAKTSTDDKEANASESKP